MKFKLFFNIFLTAISAFSYSQQSCLVKITPSESTSHSYIFFTSEYKDISQYQFDDIIENIFDEVNLIAIDWLQDEQQRNKMHEIMQLKGEENVKKIYTREDNIRYELMVINKLKSDVEKYSKTYPLYTLQLFKDSDHGSGVGFQNNNAFQLAIAHAKPVLSILSARQMEEMIIAIPFIKQAEILSNYVNQETQIITTENNYFKEYLNGNLEFVAYEMNKLHSDNYKTEVYNKILNLYLNKIISFEEQSCIYFIDASYAGGINGILQKLKERQYTIETVPFSFTLSNSIQKSDAEVDETQDQFPPFIITQEQEPTNAFIVNMDTTNKLLHSKFNAIYDPFNDLYDNKTADTAFAKQWNVVYAKDGSCSILIPVKSDWQEVIGGTPTEPVKSYTYSGNHQKSDLFYSIGYTIYPEGFNPENKATFFNDFVKRQSIKLKGEVLAQRIISTPEFVGREFTIIVSDSFFVRSKLILKDNYLYQLLSGGPANNAYTIFANTFFNSFVITDAKERNWFAFEHAFFQCNFPTTPLVNTQNVNLKSGGKLLLQSFSSEDYQQGISYLVSIYHYPLDFDFGNENLFYDELVAGAEKQYVGKAIKNEKTKKNGSTGRYAEIQLNNNKIYKVYFFIRNKTVYQYLSGGTPAAMNSDDPEYFFNTLLFVGDE